MRLSRPSTGTILGGVALFVALGGTALAATGNLVNIADPSNAANVAHVDAAGRLLVGDGTGNLTVDGTVTSRLAPPSAFWHVAASGFPGTGCFKFGTPPSGRAIILKTLTVNVYGTPAGGFTDNGFIALFNNADCSGIPIWDVTPSQLGPLTVNFDPGVGVPSTNALSAADFNGTGYGFEVYATGFTVSASSVPSSAAPPQSAAPHGPGPPAAAG